MFEVKLIKMYIPTDRSSISRIYRGVKTNPELVEKMVQWPEPQIIREVQQFLGLLNYYRKFILQHSEIVAPMVELTKKDK